MKFFHSYKKYTYSERLKKHNPSRQLAVFTSIFGIIIGLAVLQVMVHSAPAPRGNRPQPEVLAARIAEKQDRNYERRSVGSKNSKDPNSSQPGDKAAKDQLQPIGSLEIPGSTVVTPEAVQGLRHAGVTTTYFWVGELSGPDNGNIPNAESTWDGNWQSHYGGVDSPTSRNGYSPAGFTPKENPFYFALPYSDFDDNGSRRSTAGACANSGNSSLAHYSWCKNTWIAISHNGKVAYAQWEDAGPFGENDAAYVFGTAQPLNKENAKAGLDVSPAVKDYLGLGDVDKSDWWFVSGSTIPTGPWSQIITTTKGDGF